MSPLARLLEEHPLPDPSGSKDESGTVVVVAPSAACPGAGLLAVRAALRCGAGRTQLVVHPDVAAACAVAVPEVLVLGWDVQDAVPGPVARRAECADVVVIGPGTGQVPAPVVDALAGSAIVVLDAGALDHVGRVAPDRLVVAPNVAEAQDVLGVEGDPAEADVGALARQLAGSLGCPAAVRGRRAAVGDGRRTWVSDDAPPGLGTPGSGDVLMGVLAAVLAAGVDRSAALAWAIHLHAGAGARQEHPVGYLAGELVDRLPAALARSLPTPPT